MFTQLRIQNFKSWADTGEFRMAPLTGFFGTNSSGKTAILQFLLMLKQTVESSDRNRILHLGSDQYSYVDLGTTYDISHRHQLPEKIKFSFEWIPRNTPDHIVYMITEVDFKENGQIEFTPNKYTSSLKFESEINVDNDQINLEYFKYSFKASDNQWNHIAINSQTENDVETIYKLSIDGSFLENWLAFEYSNFSKFMYIFNQLVNNYSVQQVPRMRSSSAISNLGNLVSSYTGLFVNTYYLAPLREYPKRTYLWSGERPQDVGKRGELTVAALLSSKKKDSELEVSVAKALKDLGLIHGFRLNRITPNRGDYEILVQKTPNSAEVLITDVGFGVSQVLPILVLCYYAPKGATLIFEQPEIHLHPSVQAGLADIFIEVIKTRNIQIIIESHSEHLLRRLQRRMAEEKDGFINDDAALYFCKMNDQGDSELVTLVIDDYGNICNYPEGFFGDEMGDIVAMNKAAIKRQMNTEG
jgi:AAA15 family ATPase/GTPase